MFNFILIILLNLNSNETLQTLIDKSYIDSPIIKNIDSNLLMLDSANRLVNSYYYPTLNFSQSLMNSDNPVNVFAFKLNQAQFSMADLNMNSLNNPNNKTQNLSSFTLKVPIYTAGQISYKKDSLKMKKKSVEDQKIWAKKIIRQNIYSIYYGLINLNELKIFLDQESKYLKKLLSYYDAKTDSNQNRYLSYNKGRIIKVSIEEAQIELKTNIAKMIADLKYITGSTKLSLSDIDLKSADILKKIEWKNLSNQKLKREDLLAMQKHIASLEKEITREKFKYVPTLGAFANYNINTEHFHDSSTDYTLGLMLSWDIGSK